MSTISNDDLNDAKITAVGKMYISSTHSSNESIFLKRAVEILEEFELELSTKILYNKMKEEEG